jgi:hypothetical protein
MLSALGGAVDLVQLAGDRGGCEQERDKQERGDQDSVGGRSPILAS